MVKRLTALILDQFTDLLSFVSAEVVYHEYCCEFTNTSELCFRALLTECGSELELVRFREERQQEAAIRQKGAGGGCRRGS